MYSVSHAKSNTKQVYLCLDHCRFVLEFWAILFVSYIGALELFTVTPVKQIHGS